MNFIISVVLSYIIVYKLDPMISATIQKEKKVEKSSKTEKYIAFIVCFAAIMFILSLLFD